ncbi:protein artichoke-like [Homalodisca vitripennis]|uniref:protein artichoke-like n=1 Tax=Homalodisca vitripennis TaxID=197043 RepID=UPI001EECA981|nr:protein artichoke-like [Homalodisca vitripennis]XP_046674362.1 protein artichoke-like [Homalodisca vitripennis]XP_046674363.1 protein artichoke-like [Homalodisca vitripennis]
MTTHSQDKTKMWGVLWMVSLMTVLVSTDLPDQDCPDDCDCHYFRINWVTDCSESNLTSIPTVEEGLSLNVYVLNMNANNLDELQPFPAELKVRSLLLAENTLSMVDKENFSSLLYLIDLDLSSNNIRTIHPDAFINNYGLITLDLQRNPLEPVDGPFIFSRSLHYLDLSYCRLTSLNNQFFQNMTAITRLDLSGNPLTDLEAEVFDSLISLEILMLNNCNLTHIELAVFAYTEHLKRLELSQNNLIGPIDWSMVLGPLTRLEYLDLRRSGIFNLPENLFINNTFLRSLILAENELRDLELSSTLSNNLQYLDYLDLSKCKLDGPLSEAAFANATNLRTLLLSSNRLSAADLSAALAPLTRLQKLSLKNCSLTRLPANTFHRFIGLQELDISENPLNNAFTALLSPLDTLEYLNMSNSNLQRISKTTFSKMTSLKTLILSGNPVEVLESGLFQNLTNLEVLELNNCSLRRLGATVFPDNFTYPDLEELRLAHNPLILPAAGSILPRQLKRLKTLDLSHCNLTYIRPTALNAFSNITKLLLSGNSLTVNKEDSLEFLGNLPDLQYLDLSSNKLNYITPGVFKNNRDLKGVRLAGNPWKCGCNIAEMWRWAMLEKGDLSVLIGSRTMPEDIASRGGKRKKGLWCHFDKKTAPVKHIVHRKHGRTDFGDNVNRTWFRYVRESDCNVLSKVSPENRTQDLQIPENAPLVVDCYIPEEESRYPSPSICAAVGMAIFTLIVIAGFLMNKWNRISNGPLVKMQSSVSEDVFPPSNSAVNVPNVKSSDI